MDEFGPFARWPDPRAYDLIAGYNWGPFQRALLLGQETWDRSGMTTSQARAHDTVVECLTERGYVIAPSPEHTSDVVTISLPGLPGYDSNLDAMIEAWGIRSDRIVLLRLVGPVEYVGTHRVPILQGTTFGAIEGQTGKRAIGLQRDVYIVGRMDVRETPGFAPYRSIGDQRSRVRTTLRRARNTALVVDEWIPHWDEHVADLARKAEEKRLAEERARIEVEPVDEDLAAFMP
ncbi:hypothetical protein [Lichenibacterium ramalinae]|uniref:Uncharacterized protein n=1 Tax=Lichenibacterium ramalinae TaxID=2316527 RepID=A0A4Q2R5S9_9HYPH|nr:hypothetical protein [Lichenibacterium ramalinae]RYB01895.1 hypothetical protein D3272_23625 [Lichenibacterium ramalinae]